jgi:hypothetical protein
VSRRPNLATLTGGIAVLLFGAWILLDAAGVLDVTFGALAPALAAAVGVTLLVSGLARRE